MRVLPQTDPLPNLFLLNAFCRRLSVVWCSAFILGVSIECWASDVSLRFSR